MVKIFQGDCHSVETDMNNWIEVYNPRIQDVKQSIIFLEKEHNTLLTLTVLYESTSSTEKVKYRLFDRHE